MVRNPADVKYETVEAWARYAGTCRRLRWVHLAKETNHSLPKSRKQNTEIAVRKIINKRKINRILYLVLIVLLLVIPAQGSNLATETQNQHDS